MMNLLAPTICLSLIIVSKTFAHAVPPEQTLFIVDGAENVREYKTDDGSRLQLNYSVAIDYPDLAIGEAQWEKLKRRGWVKCAVKNTGWVTFRDVSTGDGRTVHRYMTHWTMGNRLITVSLSYFSALQESSRRINPDNSIQHVMVLFDTYDDIRVVEERLEILCH